ncbi:hypothetical protein Q766_02900 [Flavobacterium subsaxonicum WB 4.1-42 = DSM 21790]|uniref:Uncharacterized protein n=2 Tax=Flavobacterium TaxID=237 RepID=A0A0A2MRV0_9FLAO|nr:hypothetical protein Q766_02900 [Flavobacterium subsaxonicum WB 4.1-42 = DSM 21790]
MHITENDKEERVIRLLDLDRFIKAYSPSITIVDKISYPLVIAAEGNKRIGICFTDVRLNPNAPHWHVSEGHHDSLRQSLTNKLPEELWLVMVCEKAVDPELLKALDLAGSPLKSFNQVFLLDFHNCAVHKL